MLIYTSEKRIMEKSDWKYQEQIKNIADCPPSDYKPIDRIGFRWVFKDRLHRNNFLPPLAITPKRIRDKMFEAEYSKCAGYALSFFDSVENAIKRYLNIYNKRKNFSTTVGEYIARVEIKSDDGVASEPDKNGHFELHEFSITNIGVKAIWFCSAKGEK